MLRSSSFLLAAACAALLAACEVSVETSAPTSDLGTGAEHSETADTGALDFTLSDLDGKTHVLGDYLADGKTVVLEWFNPDCPVVKKFHKAGASSPMHGFHTDVAADDIVWLAINSGGPGKQGHGAERNRAAVVDYAIDYPVLLDETGEVGRLFGAQTTPHMFVVTPKDGLIYQGGIDDSDGRASAGSSFVSKALAEYRAGEPITAPKTKPFGCNVKYGG